jgi:pimeloyl-ACP methyl ester carboxylesterase
MEIAHHRAGSGPPLVLLHPLGADRHVWDPVLPALTAERDVIALDLPGFGGSLPLAGITPTPKALADAVAALCGRLGLTRPHVAGNSLGAWVGLELALAGHAASVTAIAPAGLWPEPLVPKAGLAHRLARAALPLATTAVRTAPGRSLLLGGAAARPRRIPSAAAVALVRVYAQSPGFLAVNDAMRAGRFASLERIRCPVTLVWPDHDRVVERPRWIPDQIVNVVLRDAGHIPMWDAPERVAQVLLAASSDARAGRAGRDAQATA